MGFEREAEQSQHRTRLAQGIGERHKPVVLAAARQPQAQRERVGGEAGGGEARGEPRQHHLQRDRERGKRVDLPVEAERFLPEWRRGVRTERLEIPAMREVVRAQTRRPEPVGQPSARQGGQLAERGEAPARERGQEFVGKLQRVERRGGERLLDRFREG